MKVLKWGSTDYASLDPGESPYVEFPHRGVAVSFLNRLRADPGGMASLRGLLRDAGGAQLPAEIGRLGDDAVVQRLAEMLVSRRLKLMRLPDEAPAPAEATPQKEEAPPPPEPVLMTTQKEEEEPPPQAEPQPPTHFVQVVVLDAVSGDPLPDVTATLKLPTGDVEALVTTVEGKARKEGLPEGAWEIQKMENEEVLEVTEVEVS